MVSGSAMIHETLAWFCGVASPHHVNAMGRKATSLLQQAINATHTRACAGIQVVKICYGRTYENTFHN
jgi:hypothetical protein